MKAGATMPPRSQSFQAEGHNSLVRRYWEKGAAPRLTNALWEGGGAPALGRAGPARRLNRALLP